MENKTVLLVNYGLTGNYNTLEEKWPTIHLGLGYLAGALIAAGYNAEIVEAVYRVGTCYQTSSRKQQDVRENLKDLAVANDEQLLSLILSKNPIIVGFTTAYNLRENIANIAKKIKEKKSNIHITLGGHDVSYDIIENTQRYLFADSVIRGEAEISIVELANTIYYHREVKKISGVCYKDHSEFHLSGLATPPDIINKKMPIYRKLYSHDGVPKEVMGILTSRGCMKINSGCDFCTTPIMHPYGRREIPIEFVLEEIDAIAANGITIFSINDDNFLGLTARSVERANLIIQHIKKLGGKIIWSFAHCRSIPLATKYLHGWGGIITRMFVGVEHVCENELINLGKIGNNFKQIKNSMVTLKDANIGTKAGIIAFNAWTELDNFTNYYERLNEIDEAAFFLHFAHHIRPYPGTPIRKRTKDEGLLRPINTGMINVHSTLEYSFRDGRVAVLAYYMGMMSGMQDIVNQDQYVYRIYLYLVDNGLGKYLVSYDNRAIPQGKYYNLATIYQSFRKEVSELNGQFFYKLVSWLKRQPRIDSNNRCYNTLVRKLHQKFRSFFIESSDQYRAEVASLGFNIMVNCFEKLKAMDG